MRNLLGDDLLPKSGLYGLPYLRCRLLLTKFLGDDHGELGIRSMSDKLSDSSLGCRQMKFGFHSKPHMSAGDAPLAKLSSILPHAPLRPLAVLT